MPRSGSGIAPAAAASAICTTAEAERGRREGLRAIPLPPASAMAARFEPGMPSAPISRAIASTLSAALCSRAAAARLRNARPAIESPPPLLPGAEAGAPPAVDISLAPGAAGGKLKALLAPPALAPPPCIGAPIESAASGTEKSAIARGSEEPSPSMEARPSSLRFELSSFRRRSDAATLARGERWTGRSSRGALTFHIAIKRAQQHLPLSFCQLSPSRTAYTGSFIILLLPFRVCVMFLHLKKESCPRGGGRTV